MAPRRSAAGMEFRAFSRLRALFAAVAADRDAEGFEGDRLGLTFLAGRPAAIVRPPRSPQPSGDRPAMCCVRDQCHCFGKAVRAAILAWVIIVTDGTSVALADQVGSLGAADRFVVRGTTQIDAEQLRQPLREDTDIVWLSRPHASRDVFMAAVVRKATLALQRAGFAEAQVHAVVELSDGVERLVLDVVEGPRFEAGKIEVAGLPDEMSARLVRFLSERQPSRDAVPRSSNKPDGTTTTIWKAADGRPATLEQPAWNPAGPATCDAVAIHHIHVEVVRFLRDEGCLSVAPPAHDRRLVAKLARGVGSATRSSSADGSRARRGPVDITFRPAGSTIDLVVAIHDLPPKAVLQRVELPPECRTTERDLIEYLGLKIGEPVNDRDRLVWRDRLRSSGRFVRHEVEFRADPTDPGAAVARFSLEEYSAATPLSQPLSREEATMLRFHDWLEEAIGRGDDLVLEGIRPTGDAAAGTTESARLILSPAAGLLLTALPDGDQACGLAVSHTDVSLLPAGGGGRLEVPLSRHLRSVNIGLSLVRDKPVGKEPSKFRRHLSFAGSIGNATEGKPAGVAVAMSIEPVACLAFVHEDHAEVCFEGDTMVIKSGGATSRFDATSGRPLGLAVAGCEVSLQAKPGSLDAAVEELRAAAGPNMLRADAPVVSAVEFLLSADVAAACGRIADAAGLRGDDRSVWECRLGQVIDLIQRCREDGGFERCDRMLAAVSSDGHAAGKVEPLDIPMDDEPTTAAAAQKAVTRHVAAVIWRLTEEHCGRDSWPAALARAGACAMVGDPAMLDEMAEFMTSEEHGPLAHVSASSLVMVPLVAASFARRGQERLSTVAFHTDCHPLLAAIGPYGLDVCCVSLVRALDDASAREIGRAVCGNPEILLPLVHALKAHERHEDAVSGLQDALDAWWDGALRGVVAAKFDAIASPRTAAAPGDHKEQPRK